MKSEAQASQSHHGLFAFRQLGRTQRGVTMIEILVTLLVLGIGLLGVAALQGVSLRTGQVSYLRTQATNIAYSVADHARAHRSIIEASGNVPNEGFWDSKANEILPDGAIDTSVAGANNNVLTVTVTWLDNREDGSTAEFAFTTRI